MNLRYRLSRLYWYLRGVLWDRHNVVKCKKLPPTWCDRDYVLLHAAFQCLTDFIEREQPWQFKASDDEIRKAYEDCGVRAEREVRDWEELRSLYNWWKEYDEASPNSVQYEESTKKLHKLVDLRGYLWT